MLDAMLLIVLMAAIAIGYGLGYRQANRREPFSAKVSSQTPQQECFVGLNYLLNEQPDEAIHTFIQALEVNSENVNTHIALGKLFRSRGEADKAARIHQNLLAHPALSSKQNEQMQLYERLLLLKNHTHALLKKHTLHRCVHCGFSCDTLQWQCPSCRYWGSIEPVTGVEGE